MPKHSFRVHAGQVKVYDTREELSREAAKTLLIGYLMLDGLKTIMMYDAYFWGIFDRPAPTHLPSMLAHNPILLRIFRMTLSMLGVKYALQTIFSLRAAPLLRAARRQIVIGARAEPWIFPEAWASVLHRARPRPRRLVELLVAPDLPVRLRAAQREDSYRTARHGQEEALPRKALQLLVAFGLSGVAACEWESYCCGRDGSPLGNVHGAFLILQAIGVFAEVVVTQAVRAMGMCSDMRASVECEGMFSRLCICACVVLLSRRICCVMISRGVEYGCLNLFLFRCLEVWDWVLIRGMDGGVGVGVL